MFGGFVKNSKHSKLLFKSLLFHPCSHLSGIGVGGWGTFTPWLSVNCGWLLLPCKNISGKTGNVGSQISVYQPHINCSSGKYPLW